MIVRLPVNRSKYENLFADDVPFKLVLDMARVIKEATTQAFIRNAELITGAKRDLFPHDRRALVETGIYNLATRHRNSGVVVQERKNASGTHSHVEVTLDHVVIIPAAVEKSNMLVREAKYRDTLAANPQSALPGLGINAHHTSPDALLAVILYGPSSMFPRNAGEAHPGFIVVRFPTSDWSGYAEGRIDLLNHLEYADRDQRPPINMALWPEEKTGT